jgi:hypothetical protein
MPVDRGRRIAAVAGILFAILTIVGFLLPGTLPKADELNNEYTQFLTDKRGKILTSDALIGLGFGFFLVFLAGLRSHLDDRGAAAPGVTAPGVNAEAEDRTLRNAVVIGGSVGAALIVAGIAVLNGIAFKAAEAGNDELNRALFDASNSLVAMAGFAFAVFFTTAGLVALANGSLPRPLALLGPAVGLLDLLGATALFVKSGFLGNGGAFGIVVGIASTLWVLAASALMFRASSVVGDPPAGATRIQERPVA